MAWAKVLEVVIKVAVNVIAGVIVRESRKTKKLER